MVEPHPAMHKVEQTTEGLRALRALIGNEPREQDLLNLLERCGGDVNTAANAFFDGGVNAAPPQQQAPPGYNPNDPAVDGRPVAQPIPGDVVAVECPQGVVGGMDIQVQTHAGLMKVTVPQGVQPGATFLVRIPAGAQGASQPPLQQPQPAFMHQPPPQYQQYQPQYQQQGYPGQSQQPQVIYQQAPQPQTIVVHSSPYYGGYGYGPDPFLYGGMGFLGGMMIADAMWY